MTTSAEQLTHGSLRLRYAGGNRPNPEAWKSLVGSKPVSARFTVLPETKPRLSALGTSLVVQTALAAFLVVLPLLFPQRMIPKALYVVTELVGPPLEAPPPPPRPKPPVEKPKVAPRPVETPAPKVQ